MIVLRFVISFFFIIRGVDIFLFFLSFFFLCELYFGLEFGYIRGVFFCGGWGFVLCILRIVVVILMYWGGGLFNIFRGFYVFFLWLIFIRLIVCFKRNSFFIFYFGFEFVVVPIFFLVIFFGYSVDRVLSSLYIFLYTILTSLPFLMFLFYNDLFFGTLSFIYVELSNRLEVCYY